MRSVHFGLLVLAGLVITLVGGLSNRDPVMAQTGDSLSNRDLVSIPGGELLALSRNDPGGPQQITVIDPRARVMSVYHVDPQTGEIGLRSVRHIRWDLQMEEYNTVRPHPSEIRLMVERR